MTLPKNQSHPETVPNLEGLKDFAESTDREEPVAFVGREKQVGALSRDLQRRFRQWQRWEVPGDPPKWEGATWLFQGAPGAGKTALLRHLKSLTVDGVAVRVCLIDKEADLCDGFRLEKKIAEAFIPGAGTDMAGTDTTQTGGGAKVGGGATFFGTRFEASAGASKGKAKQRTGLTWDDFARKVKSNPKKYPPLLLMFDEAQALGDKAGPQLRWLHKGDHGLPIVPVFGGLAWTKERFGDLGISRFADGRVHTLEGLSETEREEVVRAFFEKYRVASVSGKGKEWERLIADACQGWPQHLHVGLQALAGELGKRETGGDLARVDEAAVLKDEAKRRKRYYRDRLDSKSLKSKRHLVAAAVALLPEKSEMVADDLADIVAGIHSQTVAAKNPSRLQLPDGYSSAKFVRSMVYAGILHEDGDGYLSVPIPSFRDFLKERHSPPDQGAAPGTENPPFSAP